MTCSSCVRNIERTVLKVEGVKRAVVALATNKAEVEFDPSILGPRDIISVVEVCSIDQSVKVTLCHDIIACMYKLHTAELWLFCSHCSQ